MQKTRLFLLLFFCCAYLSSVLFHPHFTFAGAPPPPNLAPAAAFSAESTNNTLSTAAALQNAILKIGFVWNQAVPNGTIEVLLRAADTGSNDASPDVLAYDFGAHSANTIPITCPANIPGYTFISSTSTPHGVTIHGTNYHRFTCTYNGTGAIGTDFTTNPMIIGNSTTALINPAASSQHLAALDQVNWGEAPAAYIRLLDQADQIILSREIIPTLNLSAIRTTARIAEELSFRITGTPVNTSACDALTTDPTTATTIVFNAVTPLTFSRAAQRLEVISSASGGYNLTLSQNDQMSLTGSYSCPGDDGTQPDGSLNRDCIPDFTAGSASPTTTAPWASPTDFGFGYTLEKFTLNPNTSATSFNYTQGYRQLADRSASEDPVTIATNSFVTNQDLYYVCYQLAVSPENPFGAYENSVNYILTTTF